MAIDIDMKSYAGEVEPLAAAEQQNAINAYEAQTQHEELVNPSLAETSAGPEAQPAESAVQVEKDNLQDRNFKALSESVERLKAERESEKREYQLQLDLLRANLNKPAPELSKQKQMFDGMEDSDVPNVGELRRAWAEREAAYNERIEELQVANQNSDYAEVLNKYGKQLAQTDPFFLQGLRGAENKALFAYQYAKREQELQSLREAVKQAQPSQQTQQSTSAQKIVENARKPGTLAQVGGQSALSKADYFASMSDQDFMKMASKYLEGI